MTVGERGKVGPSARFAADNGDDAGLRCLSPHPRVQSNKKILLRAKITPIPVSDFDPARSDAVPRFGKSSSTYRYRKWKSFPVIKANRNFLLVDLFRKRNSKNALSRTIFIIVNCALCHILYIFLHISHILHTIALPWTRLLFALTETFYFVSFLHAFKYRINVRKS